MKIKRFQEGGQMAPAPQEQGGQPQAGGEEQIIAMAQQIIEQVGPEGAAMLAQAIMQMLQGAQEQAQAEPQQPTYQKRGGKLIRVK